MPETETKRQVWVGCLACYNDGTLNGEWREPANAVDWECQRTNDGLHEETWIFDHEGFGADIGEMSPIQAAEIDARMTADEDAGIPGPVAEQYRHEYGQDAVIAFLGTADTFRAWCEEWMDEGIIPYIGTTLPDDVYKALLTVWAEWSSFIDMDAIERNADAAGGYAVYEHNGAVYVFSAF